MFYRLDWKSPTPGLANTKTCSDPGVPWTMGVRYPEPVPEPIICTLNPARGEIMRDIFLVDVPLFSDRVVDCLTSIGVSNIDLYQTEIHGHRGEIHRGYKAVNIVGAVACADLERSVFVPGGQPPMMGFSELVIDEQRARGHDLFRLAEDTLWILLSERVRQALTALDLVGATITPVQDRST